jgi:hypothetical protein
MKMSGLLRWMSHNTYVDRYMLANFAFAVYVYDLLHLVVHSKLYYSGRVAITGNISGCLLETSESMFRSRQWQLQNNLDSQSIVKRTTIFSILVEVGFETT